MLLGGIDFSNLFINLSSRPAATLAEAKAANIPVISYGVFLDSIIFFLIQAWAIFFTDTFCKQADASCALLQRLNVSARSVFRRSTTMLHAVRTVRHSCNF